MKTIIVDIDGTIAKVGERIKYLKMNPPNWELFYNASFQDKPIMKIIDLVRLLSVDFRIWFLTGRRESVRGITYEWLDVYFGKYFPIVLSMRANGDKRHDIEVKPEKLKMLDLNINNVELILEDRNSMVKKWREIGYTCLQVAEGDF